MYKILIKPILEIFFALTALIITFPAILILSLISFIDSRQFPIFIQERALSFSHKKIKIYKIRTISAHTVSSSNVLYKDELSDYISSFGAFLRKTGLDELPQLLNVLKGELSLIGPRPLSLSDLKIIRSEFPDLYKQRESIIAKPGITGYWQVYGKRPLGVKNLVENDIYYSNNISLRTDTKIILKTIKIMLLGMHSDAIIQPGKILLNNDRRVNARFTGEEASA